MSAPRASTSAGPVLRAAPAIALAIVVAVFASASCGTIETLSSGASSSADAAPPPAASGGRDAAGRSDASADAGGSCPAPRTGFVCDRRPYWGRDLSSGACCEYPSACEVPENMPRFTSEEACLNDCRCAEVTPEGERITLECYCQNGTCPADLAEESRRSCEGPLAGNMARVEGCGRIAIELVTGYVGSSKVFDAESGRLIGVSSRSDSQYEPCQTFRRVAGRQLDCDETTACRLCPGPSSSSLPDCE
jgi:hypothetical protein